LDESRVIIRRASVEDAALLAELGARAFSEAFSAQTPEADLAAYLAGAFTVEQLALELADPRSTFLIALIGGGPAGYAKLHTGPALECIPDRPAIELVRCYSLKAWWGRGVGAALVETCLRIARQGGYATIWLSSWKINDRANAFYRKWGFREVGEKTFVVGTDVQEDFVMARSP
jgi:ribosomal protein S18 acetylase RimI-like enzyme